MKLLYKLGFNYLILLCTFLITIISVHLIPSDSLRDNVLESTAVLENEGIYPKFLNFKLFQLDNFTDAMMLNVSAAVNSEEPIKSSMLNYYYQTPFEYLKIIEDTKAAAVQVFSTQERGSYGRYWHGYLVFLRPLLVVFDLSQIRILNYVVLGILFFISMYLIKRRINVLTMILFGSSLLLINFPIVPLSMQFSTVFYIALIGIIILIVYHQLWIKNGNWLLFFFSIGAFTSFMDFLTAPLITLGLPLIIFALLKGKNVYEIIIKASIMWISGYSLMWASKWLMCYFFTDYNIFNDAMSSATLRTSNAYQGMEMTIPNIISFIVTNLRAYGLLWPLTWVFVLAVSCYMLLVKSWEHVKANSYFLLIALMVPTWYLVLRNHSIQHGWFTWRALVVTLFSIMLFLWNTTSIERIKTILRIKPKSK